MWQPRLGISWDPKADGKTVVRLNGGLFYGRVPGLALASSRSTNGSRAQNALPRQLLQRLRRHAAHLPQPAPAPRPARACPTTRASSSSTRTSRTRAPGRPRSPSSARSCQDLAVLRPVQLRQGRAHHALPRAQRHRLRLPWGTGLSRGRTASPAALRRRRPHERRVDGQEQLQRAHLRPHQALRRQLPVPGQLHAVLGQVRRRQRARPVHLPLHPITTTSTPSTATPTATSATA